MCYSEKLGYRELVYNTNECSLFCERGAIARTQAESSEPSLDDEGLSAFITPTGTELYLYDSSSSSEKLLFFDDQDGDFVTTSALWNGPLPVPGYKSHVIHPSNVCNYVRGGSALSTVCPFIITYGVWKAVFSDPTQLLKIATATCVTYSTFCNSFERLYKDAVGVLPGNGCKKNRIIIYGAKWYVPAIFPSPIITPYCEF